MRQDSAIRRWLAPLRRTPLHPQWVVFRGEKQWLQAVGRQATGTVLDIGAGQQQVRRYLPADCRYISLDYYQTAVEWYHTRPQLFGDGQCLPIKADSMDTVLLLDVLEHLPCPDACIAEIQRVLRPAGKLILQVPFMYPLHDAPHDFHRWTEHGLRHLASRHQFVVESATVCGQPTESAALLLSLAFGRTALNWIRGGNPLLILTPVLALLIVATNLLGWLLARLSRRDPFMPHSYQAVWKNPA